MGLKSIETDEYKGMDTIRLESYPPAPFSLPLEGLTFKPPKEAVVQVFNNGDSIRMIYNNVPNNEKELKNLEDIERYCKANGIRFSPRIWSRTTRYLTRVRGKAKAQKAVNFMKATEEWMSVQFQKPIIDTEILEDLKSGIVYFGGRDKCMRPMICLISSRIPTTWYTKEECGRLKRLLLFHMEYVQRYMFVPGRIENLNVMLDFDNVSVTNVPLMQLKEIVKLFSAHYVGRVYKIFAYRIPRFFGFIYEMAKGLLSDRQRAKITFTRDCAEVAELFLPSQLEKRYGGTRDDLEGSFYPFRFLPGPFTDDAQDGASGIEVPDAHIVLSQEMINGGEILKSTTAGESNLSFLTDTPRHVEILQAAQILPQYHRTDSDLLELCTASKQCAQQELPMSPSRESASHSEIARQASMSLNLLSEELERNGTAGIANGLLEEGNAAIEDGYDEAAANARINQQTNMALLESVSTMPEVGSIISDRSLAYSIQPIPHGSDASTASEGLREISLAGGSVDKISFESPTYGCSEDTVKAAPTKDDKEERSESNANTAAPPTLSVAQYKDDSVEQEQPSGMSVVREEMTINPIGVVIIEGESDANSDSTGVPTRGWRCDMRRYCCEGKSLN